MDASMHTLKGDTSLEVKVDTSSDWNPWLMITHDSNKMVLRENITIHLSGLSIDEGYAFSDSWDEAGHAIREWVNYRSSEATEETQT